ncbi:MAG: BON domain-containing protein [Acidobacteriota bacterium]|nr:BON domain-containing protein [Acidobacteriota bacterium]
MAFGLGFSSNSIARAMPKPEVASQSKQQLRPKPTEASIARNVQRNLVELPWYGIFDNLEYKVEGSTVVVSGQVLFPVTKESVTNAVKGIRGVERVVNNVQEESNSPMDNQLRAAIYHALFSDGSPLFYGSLGVNPGIHIIVSNGRVALDGVVNSQLEKQYAYAKARSVPGAISVTNNLRIENSSK